MKKMKKLFAILMTMAMVMGLGITGFAATSTTVRVDNLEEGSTISYLQIIEPSPTKATGWAFTDEAEAAFIDAFNITTTGEELEKDLQDIISAMQTGTVNATDFTTALNNLNAGDFTDVPENGNSFNVQTAGVYAIIAEAASGSETIYARMTAYVAFGYKTDGSADGVVGETVVVNAKKTQIPTKKEASGMTDETVGIGDTVTYTITTAVPYDKTEWTIKDSITGAKYITNDTGALDVTITLGNNSPVPYSGTVTPSAYNEENKTQDFTIDLKNYLAKENQGKTLVITYQAKVTAESVENTAHNSSGRTDGEEKLYSGYITFTKKGEVGSDDVLANAGFKVQDKTSNKWATFREENDGVYILTGWVDNEDDATEVFTIKDGTVQVRGLDADTYIFKETTAPSGYSLSSELKEVVLAPTGEVANAVFSATGDMNDTQLTALPETGGMGTTLFTIAGCVIMISAAGLFFATRKKAS